MKVKRNLINWLPWMLVILVLGGIFCMSTEAFSSSATRLIFGQYNYIVRKAAHFAEYAILFCVLRWALSLAMRRRYQLLTAVSSLVLCMLYAISDEWHQMFVPARTGSWNDVVLDFSGALFAFTCWLAFSLLSRRRATD